MRVAMVQAKAVYDGERWPQFGPGGMVSDDSLLGPHYDANDWDRAAMEMVMMPATRGLTAAGADGDDARKLGPIVVMMMMMTVVAVVDLVVMVVRTDIETWSNDGSQLYVHMLLRSCVLRGAVRPWRCALVGAAQAGRHV